MRRLQLVLVNNSERVFLLLECSMLSQTKLVIKYAMTEMEFER